MRLYLDTNILFFLFQKDEDKISRDVSAMLDDYSNQLRASLLCVAEHHDVVDRLIIAQAITDRATLVSSDLKFPKYEGNGLRLVVNRKRGAD
ncbi:MAG: hypothetical protein LUC86_06215 [Prevotellaceae bacterium]|nr:hypothetical protein [Prevotellaceae bacterium]